MNDANHPHGNVGALPWLAIAQPAIFAVVLALAQGSAATAPVGSNNHRSLATSTGLRVATFAVDATPPFNHPLCGGWIKPLEAVDDPLLAKGLLLDDGHTRVVLCAVDWCLLQTKAHDLFRRKLAVAAQVPTSQVTVHTVHQHNAPIADVRAQELLDQVPNAPAHLDEDFVERLTDRLAIAVRAARHELRPVTHVGWGAARVAQFASNRRVRLADGAIHVRFSATTDPVLQAAAEGFTDPWLRSVTLFDGTTPRVRLHYYASHPQSYYGDGRATADTVGLARERIQREEGVPQIYFTGCAGNLTAGKYNDGSPRAREVLTDRVAEAMRAAIHSTQRTPVSHLRWRVARAAITGRKEDAWNESLARRTLASPKASPSDRLRAALNVAWSERLHSNPAVELGLLTLGPILLLHLPGEAFLEYQKHAQLLRPDKFVVVAAYGESGPGYICVDAALSEGGYEPTMSRVGPPTEWRLREAITQLLRPDPDTPATTSYADRLRVLSWRDANGQEHPVTTQTEWDVRRRHILDSLQRVTGPLPTHSRAQPPALKTLTEEQRDGLRQIRILFEAEPEDWVPALLLIPERGLRGPGMLCLHQTTPLGKLEPAGLGGNPHLHYARELALRGYTALAPDYPNFGDYRVDPYERGYASATAKAIWNHLRAVDLLASLPSVDRERMGVMGHSLGGHNALFVAAFEPRLRAIVTSCGFNSFYKYMEGNLTGWSHRGYMPRLALFCEADPRAAPFDFTEILASLAPRPVFVHAPVDDSNFEISGVLDCLAAARPVYRLWNAESALVARHPACGHDFPDGDRRAAYAWLDAQLR